jgi:hypothetical protein
MVWRKRAVANSLNLKERERWEAPIRDSYGGDSHFRMRVQHNTLPFSLCLHSLNSCHDSTLAVGRAWSSIVKYRDCNYLRFLEKIYSLLTALRRWLQHYDGILQMDMDVTWISFNHSVYDLYRNTCNIFAASGGPELVMIKNVEMSHCVVDSWWYHGTGPGCAGCRYVKYPQSHKVQTQNLDMPWFWYALLHCAQVYGAGPFEFECL